MASNSVTASTLACAATETKRRDGALACMEALRKLEKRAEDFEHDETAEQYYVRRLDNAKALAKALGPMPPELEGAIRALSEYIHMTIEGGQPSIDPGHWLPLCAMTDDEQAAIIAEAEADRVADLAATAAKHKVIPLRPRA